MTYPAFPRSKVAKRSNTYRGGKDAKVKNFQHVEAHLRALKVKFDGKLIH